MSFKIVDFLPPEDRHIKIKFCSVKEQCKLKFPVKATIKRENCEQKIPHVFRIFQILSVSITRYIHWILDLTQITHTEHLKQNRNYL